MYFYLDDDELSFIDEDDQGYGLPPSPGTIIKRLDFGTQIKYDHYGTIREGIITSYITEDGSDYFRYEVDKQFEVDPLDVLSVIDPVSKCECGAHAVKDGMHSSWCALYEPIYD